MLPKKNQERAMIANMARVNINKSHTKDQPLLI